MPSLLEDQRTIVGCGAKIIIDVGAHHGHSSAEYLRSFQDASIFALEPDPLNFAKAQDLLAEFGGRARLFNFAASDRDGTARLNRNTHDGTHSLFEIGDQTYWGGFAQKSGEVEIETVTLDTFASTHGIEHIDILKLDIQGAELLALVGASELLRGNRISLIATEVEFYPLYQSQPLFWDVGSFLQQHGFRFYGLYDCHYHAKNNLVLSWADAIFLAPRFTNVPEWDPP
jgi:FkbM family methyltransferase